MPGPAPAIVWRDGVHLRGTVVWCDARRARDVCFVSSAARIGRAGHGQLIATAATLAQLRAPGVASLPARYGRPLSLGTVVLELQPNGDGVGGAMLLATVDGRRVVYAGAVAPGGVGLGGPAVTPRADVLVLAARYGDRPAHGTPAAARAATVAWAQQVVHDRALPVLLVPTARAGLDVVAALAEAGLRCGAHRRVHDLARALAGAAELPTLHGVSGRGADALVWLTGDGAGRARAVGNRPHVVAMVSGGATDPETVALLGASHGIAWATSGFADELHAWIDATGAQEIYVLDAGAPALVAALGARARLLTPPTQLAMWPPHEGA